MEFESNGRLHRIYKYFVMMYCMDITNYFKNMNNDDENTKDIEDSQEQPVGEPGGDDEDLLDEDGLVIDEYDTEFEEVDPGNDDPDLEDEVIANDTVQESSDSK